MYNSTYPFGGNDGVVWAGRGLRRRSSRRALQSRGVLSATLAPVVFRAENQSFDLFANGQTENLSFNDGQFPLMIDKPQRFGEFRL